MPKGVYERYTSAQIKELHEVLKKNHAMPKNPKRAREAGRRLNWEPSRPTKAREAQPQYEAGPSPSAPIPTPSIPPLAKLGSLPFCKDAQLFLANYQRWLDLLKERAELQEKRNAAVKAHVLVLVEFDLMLKALDQEEGGVVEEGNGQFYSVVADRAYQAAKRKKGPTSARPRRRWTAEEIESFEKRAVEILKGSSGFTVNLIATELGVGKHGARRALDQMVGRKVLRRIGVMIQFGGGPGGALGYLSERKGQGYALPLREVA